MYNKTIKQLREEQYSYNLKNFQFLNNWKENPYTFLKAKFYMESSALLVYLLLKTRIKPNTITIMYALCGIVGGLLLAIPNTYTIIISLAIFFLKGILDWSDGHLARITGQTSVTGHVLDIYGAHLNEVGFFLGLGFFVAFHSEPPIFFYLIPLYPFLVSINILVHIKGVLWDEILPERIQFQSSQNIPLINKGDNKEKNNKSNGIKQKTISLLKSFLDSRARTVDLICLIILIELFYPIRVSWIIFILLLLKHLIIFGGSFYLVVQDNWVEKTISNIYPTGYNTKNN